VDLLQAAAAVVLAAVQAGPLAVVGISSLQTPQISSAVALRVSRGLPCRQAPNTT
jgi:hypothetical protein